MILNKVARCYGKQIGFFSNRTFITQQQQQLSGQYILGSKRLYTTQQQNNNNKDNKDQSSTSDKESKTEDKKEDKKDSNDNKEEDEDVKRRRFAVPPLITSVSSMLMLGTIIASTLSYAAYNYKKDITEEERYRLTPMESKIRESVAEPFREFFDSLFNNLRKYELFDSLFGPAKIHKVLPPPIPGGKKYTLVIDIDALTEITKSSKYPTVYKRAGLDYFLEHLKKDYEIYLFFNANVPQNKIEQLFFKIDNSGQYFTGQLFSDNGLKERNQFSKKVEMLDRDPSKVIFIDAASPYQHPNVINVGKFKSNSKDTLLIELLPVLENFSKKKIEDVRPEIKNLQDIENQSLSKMLNDYMKEHNIVPRIKKQN